MGRAQPEFKRVVERANLTAAFDRVHANHGCRWVVDANVDAFFDTVDHGLMIEKITRLIQDEAIVSLFV